MKQLCILLAVVFVTGCASAPQKKQSYLPKPIKISAERLDNYRQNGEPVPKLIYPPVWPKSEIPKESLKSNFECWVLVAYDISPDGTTTNLRVVETQNSNKKFEAAARRAIAISTFEPQKEAVLNVQRQVTFRIEI